MYLTSNWRRPVTALLMALALASAGVAAPARAAVYTTDETSVQHSLDAIVQAGAVGALAEVRDAYDRRSLTSGRADVSSNRPVPPGGHFRIGSVTKTFTATVLLQLVGEGRVGLDDPIERYLPGLVPNGQAITVRHLLNHTSGIVDYLDDTEAVPVKGEAFLTETRFRTFTPRELVRIATRHEPYFAPGGGFHYSNTGYVLAGLIIEQVTGRSYAKEVERRILRPLHLRDTSVPGTSTGIPGPNAHGYLPIKRDGQTRLVDVTRLNPSMASSAGEMLSTAADLNRFFSALLGGKLLRPAELKVMQTGAANDGRVTYGMGLWWGPRTCGVTVWGHGGSIPGYRTMSVHSADGRHLTVSYTPSTATGTDEAGALEAMIDTVFCGAKP